MEPRSQTNRRAQSDKDFKTIHTYLNSDRRKTLGVEKKYNNMWRKVVQYAPKCQRKSKN